MPNKENLANIIPDGFIEHTKADILSNGGNTKLLIKMEEIVLIEFNGISTEITISTGKVLKILGDVAYVKKSILIAQAQLKGEIFVDDPVQPIGKTTFLEWMAYQRQVSVKLSKVLRQAEEVTGIKYIEEMTETSFKEIPRAGKLAWSEFIQLQGY